MKKFICKILMSDTGVSSKRVNGTIGYLVYTIILISIVIINLIKSNNVTEITASLLQVYLFTSAGLLGLGGAVEGIKSKLTKK